MIQDTLRHGHTPEIIYYEVGELCCRRMFSKLLDTFPMFDLIFLFDLTHGIVKVIRESSTFSRIDFLRLCLNVWMSGWNEMASWRLLFESVAESRRMAPVPSSGVICSKRMRLRSEKGGERPLFRDTYPSLRSTQPDSTHKHFWNESDYLARNIIPYKVLAKILWHFGNNILEIITEAISLAKFLFIRLCFVRLG